MPEAHAATQLSSTIGHSLYSSCKPVKLAAAALLPMDGAIAMYARINDPAVTRGWHLELPVGGQGHDEDFTASGRPPVGG